VNYRGDTVTCHACGHENLHGAKYCSQCAALLRNHAAEAGRGGGHGTAVIVVLSIVAATVVLFFVFGSGSVEGQIQARGKPWGTWSMTPTDCHSGQHQSFFGVWVAPELKKSGGREGFKGGLKIMKSPLEEWNVYVESPLECESFKCKIYELPRSACRVFDVDVKKTSNMINDIWIVEGHAKLDCTTPEGGAVTANLKFDGCH
jgi:hypothetical protein